MTMATCSQCGTSVPASDITYTLVGSYCRSCHVNETADAARLERQFLRSIGRRQLIIGIVMLAIGGAILALGLGTDSTVVLVPAGMLLGGIVEIGRGFSNLSSSPA